MFLAQFPYSCSVHFKTKILIPIYNASSIHYALEAIRKIQIKKKIKTDEMVFKLFLPPGIYICTKGEKCDFFCSGGRFGKDDGTCRDGLTDFLD